MEAPDPPALPIISPDGRFYWTSTGWAALPSATPIAIDRERDREQPYEKTLNDATEAAAFVFNGLLFWAGWLGSFFLLSMIGVTLFGDMPSVIDYVLFFGTILVGFGWAGGFKEPRVHKSPGPLKCRYVEGRTLGYCHCGAPRVHHTTGTGAV